MDRFIADLHIHSRFSRATSKNLTIRNLAAWGRLKGIGVLGTGDFTHPGWLDEIEENLQQDADGLLSLKDPTGLEKELPDFGAEIPGRTRFILQSEISSIYKRGGKVRKVHNLVYMPDLDSVRKFNQKLAKVGNLESDGRPILGLDSRHLLEMVLETHPRAFLVPAHIWTPWFSLFGSKSGFDTIEECYGEYAKEIFALETGLSSDPEMNWHWSALDRFRLISNSDAHSGEKLGREANLFEGEASFEGIYKALKGEGLGHKFLGTIEFFPEEGKYHMDGHRKCGVMLDPLDSRSRGNICPVCGKPLTLGVQHRVMELADREQPEQPAGMPGFTSLIPLKEVLSEILGVGPGTKKVAAFYNTLLRDFGSEIAVLRSAPFDDLKKHSPFLAEGLMRMREGRVRRRPGYDGEYGVISVFTEDEQRQIKSGGKLIKSPTPEEGPEKPRLTPMGKREEEEDHLVFNQAQRQAVDAGPGPVLVLAGPGTGKTQTLMGRVRRLLDQDVDPLKILCLTFTRRAAGEMAIRLFRERGESGDLPQADTLHALAFDYWSKVWDGPPTVLDDQAARNVFAETNPQLEGPALKRAWEHMNLLRERREPIEDELFDIFRNYQHQKDSWNLVDYTDLLEFVLEQIDGGVYEPSWEHILVDEVQDLSPLQLDVIKGLVKDSGEGFFAIGDPNQSIYGFRGATGDVQKRLTNFWPGLTTITLKENYRSAQNILDLSAALFPESPRLLAVKDKPSAIKLFQAPDAQHEASWMGERIKALLGATSHSLADAEGHGDCAPGDIAILVRFRALIAPLEAALDRMGIPVAAPETEAFWHEPRIMSVLKAAGRFLGVSVGPEDGDVLDLPEKILARGPVGMQAYLTDVPPFDQVFWQSRAFKELKKEYEHQGGWAGLINWVNLQSDLDQVSKNAEKVQIMTMHAAKGLEFEAVFLPALEEGIMPFAGVDVLMGKADRDSLKGQADPEEEKRLLYVAMTRARRELYLSQATVRRIYGKRLQLPLSRFFKRLPVQLISKSTMAARTVTKEKKLSLLD